MLYFVHVIHFQSSLRVKEGSAQWVRILRSAFFLNRLSANSPYLGPDFPATLGYLVLSICETSVGSWNTLGFISAFLTASLESPALNHLQHLSSSLCPCVLMLKMKISSLSFSIASWGARAGEHLYSVHCIELEVIYPFFSYCFSLLVCSSFIFIL